MNDVTGGMRNIGANIWFAMQAKNMSFKDIQSILEEKSIHISGANLRLIVNGEKILSFHELQIFAEILGVETTNLLEENNNYFRMVFGDELASTLTDREKIIIDKFLDNISFINLWTNIDTEEIVIKRIKENNGTEY